MSYGSGVRELVINILWWTLIMKRLLVLLEERVCPLQRALDGLTYDSHLDLECIPQNLT